MILWHHCKMASVGEQRWKKENEGLPTLDCLGNNRLEKGDDHQGDIGGSHGSWGVPWGGALERLWDILGGSWGVPGGSWGGHGGVPRGSWGVWEGLKGSEDSLLGGFSQLGTECSKSSKNHIKIHFL